MTDRKAVLAALCVLCVLQGCTLPRSGPMLGEMDDARDHNDIQLVSVTPAIAQASREAVAGTFPLDFLRARPVDYNRLAPGDGVDIVLWGQDTMGVFTSSANMPGGAGRMTDLGEMIVDQNGMLHVPEIGDVRASGLTLDELHNEIVRRMSRVTIGLDASVSRTDRRGQTVTVEGDLAKPGVYPIRPGLTRLSGLLSQAAPNQTNPEALKVTVRRAGESASVRLSDIYRNGAEDIALRAGDSIVVHDVLDSLVVLGAMGTQSKLKISKRNYTVLDALGDSRGMDDALANPKAVFVLRIRPDERPTTADEKPVVYQFDFTQPEQLVLAGKFSVQDGDAIYISDAPFAQALKVLSVFRASLSSSYSKSSSGGF